MLSDTVMKTSIVCLQNIIERLQIVERGKHYTPERENKVLRDVATELRDIANSLEEPL